MQHHSGRSGDAEQKHGTNGLLFALQIGFFAGIIWGTLRWFFFEMKFTKVLPGYLLEPFFRHDFLRSVWGIVVGIAGYTLLSMAAALLYKLALGKLRGPWPGIVYGVIWWAVIFLLLGPLLGLTERVNQLGWDTIIAELCVSTLWGLFIGYSIAFEFTDEASREPMGAK